MKMQKKDFDFSFRIKYKKNYLATKNTSLKFFLSTQNLCNLLKSGITKKIFVTDSNIFDLNSTRKFFDTFQKIENTLTAENEKTKISFYKNLSNEKIALIVLQPGEEYKTIDYVLSIVKFALDFKLTRKDIFCAIGGGVVTDITAFASSIYKRGTFFEAVPTTLLSMVDAAIGGKTGVDFDNYKNIIGTFFPAKTLYVFFNFIQSLPEQEFKSGLAEVIKTALLFDKKLFYYIENHKEKILSRDESILIKIIFRCAKLKSKIVQKDLTEKKERMLLNFGHTFAHALESCAGLGKLTHGECVAWGILKSLKTSVILNLCKDEYYNKVCNLLKAFDYQTDLTYFDFFDAEQILRTMKNDKKNSSSRIRLILQKNICKNLIAEVSDKIILQVLSL